MTDFQTVGGYGPESLPGHSGSDTSEEAARRPGVGKKTMEVYHLLETFEGHGMTVGEAGFELNLSHGAASGALSRLHRAGMICRLSERRKKQLVYVHPDHVNGREMTSYTPNAAYREDRKPMPLERPEPTLESITADLLTTIPPGSVLTVTSSEPYARWLAPGVLEIVKKYR